MLTVVELGIGSSLPFHRLRRETMLREETIGIADILMKNRQ